MSAIVELQRMERRRLEKFHEKCRNRCGSSKKFREGFDVDRSHISAGTLKNPRRFSLSNEHLAATIQQGLLLLDKCRVVGRLEIAVTGLFKDYEWTEFGAGQVRKVVENCVKVRVVIREIPRRSKDLIVTAYVEDPSEADVSTLPEINCEVW